MFVYPATLRKKMWESTATISPSSPRAVMAFARKLTPENDGFAETDRRIGVDVQLLIATLVMDGVPVPRIARPWEASVSRLFETGMVTFCDVTSPTVEVLEPNLSRQ